MSPAYLALALTPGIGRVRMDALLGAFGSASAVLDASLSRLRSVPGITRAAATAIKAAALDGAERVMRETERLGGRVLTPDDAEFPARLRDIPDAPLLLFAAGRLEVLDTPCIAMVGSRDHSRYGAEVCRHLAGEAARAGLTVVSGMARGLDAVAHEAALAAPGASVGVLGNGLGVIYPAANRRLYERMAERGCLITEHPPGERPSAGSFPRRNRLISGLARATVVVEAKIGSGALITADQALLQAREVLAVPGPITSPVSAGTNRLIQLGAKPVLELRDLLEEFDIDPAVPQVSLPADLTRAERRILDLLADGKDRIDDLVAGLGKGPAEALAVVTSLEIRGLVRNERGAVSTRLVR